LVTNTLFTLQVTMIGFALSLVMGVFLAVLITYSSFLKRNLLPLLVVAQAVPKVALAPLLLVWAGYGAPTAIATAFLVAFFPIVVNTATGLQSVAPELLDLSRSLSASEGQTFRKIVLPSALPLMFSGAKIAVTLSLIGAVIGEFMGSEKGLGPEILIASTYLKTDVVFAAIAVLSLMGIFLFYAVEVAERIFCPWASREKE
jgi:NitT/TauT family transport system permease protein